MEISFKNMLDSQSEIKEVKEDGPIIKVKKTPDYHILILYNYSPNKTKKNIIIKVIDLWTNKTVLIWKNFDEQDLDRKLKSVYSQYRPSISIIETIDYNERRNNKSIIETSL